jgi:hypothetical protein
MIDHFVMRYIGMKWKDDYNCFDHFCHVQKMQFKRLILDEFTKVPEYEDRKEALQFIKDTPNLRNKWRACNQPKEGVEGHSFHIGTYIESNNVKGILHCDKKMGVVLTPLQTLRDNNSTHTYLRYGEF